MNRKEAEELLPWFVAGTLSEDEHRAVQAFVDSGEIPAADVNELKIFAATIAEQAESEPAYNPAILDKAMAKLDTTEQAVPTEAIILPEASRSSPSLLRKLGDWFNWQATPPWAKLAIGAQFGVVLVLGMLMLNQPNVQTGGQGSFTTVSGQSTMHADIVVGFSPGITEADLRELLGEFDAQIVAGPNSLGMYSIMLGGDPDRDIGASIAELTMDARIQFAQPAAQ
jgi:hypothetical protein